MTECTMWQNALSSIFILFVQNDPKLLFSVFDLLAFLMNLPRLSIAVQQVTPSFRGWSSNHFIVFTESVVRNSERAHTGVDSLFFDGWDLSWEGSNSWGLLEWLGAGIMCRVHARHLRWDDWEAGLSEDRGLQCPPVASPCGWGFSQHGGWVPKGSTQEWRFHILNIRELFSLRHVASWDQTWVWISAIPLSSWKQLGHIFSFLLRFLLCQ